MLGGRRPSGEKLDLPRLELNPGGGDLQTQLVRECRRCCD
jgi:hypothetical protein